METEKRGRPRNWPRAKTRAEPKAKVNSVPKGEIPEVAKNFDIEVSIHCTVCDKVYKLSECLKEEAMPVPYQTVTEVFLLCPNCGDRKHTHYLSEYVRFQQTKLTRALRRYHETQDLKDWRAYNVLHRQFKTAFDAVQKRYKALFGEETTSESRGK